MLKKILWSSRRIIALARLIVIDGLRRHALIGLILFALAGITGGLLFFDFIPREIGRASNDFLFSIIYLTGFVFLLFHAVQVMAWDTERGALHTYLARPISRTEYALALFSGLAALLLLLNLILCGLGWLLLGLIKDSVQAVYFPRLSFSFFLLAGAGLYCIELIILSVILLFSSAVRGSFAVLLLTLCYYFICSGLPVVRASIKQESGSEAGASDYLLGGLTALFPDFSRLDFKTLAVSTDLIPPVNQIVFSFGFSLFYIILILWLSCFIYTRRDLH
ncbi:hypothetical protein [Desulfopila inferna]|uniref:hypothetical protein n=1 Tax=Desulfopila inferna TaxID=468528 RepID=UPI0019641BBE|nr:hypothetical protein [Desulfopila inferna]MBM9603178.1 hypothetical protein [Desulfopila inferna]